MSSSFLARLTGSSPAFTGAGKAAPSAPRPARKTMPSPAQPTSTPAPAKPTSRTLPAPAQSTAPKHAKAAPSTSSRPGPSPSPAAPEPPKARRPSSAQVPAAPSSTDTQRAARPTTASRSQGSRFTSKKVLGKGAFADVWLAHDNVTREDVAIKVIHSRRHFKAAQYEYCIGNTLDHPNIVKILNCFKTDEQMLLVQEFAAGGELFDRIIKDYGMEEEDIRRVFSDLLDALAYLHSEGIVHRDIKPENVVLGKDDRAMLCDFGMAEFSGQTVQHGPGTLPYMPPETLSSKKTYVVDPSQDIWSLGIVLYILLTGDFPWMKARVSDSEFADYAAGNLNRGPWANFTPELKELLSRLLAIDPAMRCTAEEARAYLHDPWFVKRNPPKTPSSSASSAPSTPAAKPQGNTGVPLNVGSSSSASSSASFDL